MCAQQPDSAEKVVETGKYDISKLRHFSNIAHRK